MSSQKTFKLNTGAEIPAIGLGTWLSGKTDDSAYTSVKEAIKVGYRHIDTAYMYLNEAQVGRGVRDGLKENGLERKDIFVTTKLTSIHHRPEKVVEAFNESLESLDIEYIDLYLVHWPVPLNPASGELIPSLPDGSRDLDEEMLGRFDVTWAAMEKLLDTGKVKAIGVSNFSIHNLERLLKTAKVVPAVNQVELHPFNPQNKLLEYCSSKGIHCTAYSPLGTRNGNLIDNSLIAEIAAAHNALPAQVLISWGITRSSVLPKSVTPSRIKANFETIELSKEDIERINTLGVTHHKRFVYPEWGVPVFDEDFEDSKK
ncbi:NADP-dependent oxidoreductase domain-containing protein [Phycomyces nitens]|nr:NADP-dependent oxidoreductase domain-containing protein [Phycomyces nitens]